jgi:lipoyl(octanoyl) transferase
MDVGRIKCAEAVLPGSALRVYLLGVVDFEAVLALQRSLVYQVAGDREGAALVLCEHSPLITVGRHGSVAHIHGDREELRSRRLGVRWVNRGGGCLLHLPGQLLAYPVLALDRQRLGVEAYVGRLQAVVRAVLADFGIRAETRPGAGGVWVGRRLIAEVGVAVRDWVSYFGVALNVNPDLAPFRLIQNGASDDGPMTSLERERHGPLRPALVRQSFLEHFGAAFPFERTSVFFNHPQLAQGSGRGAGACC